MTPATTGPELMPTRSSSPRARCPRSARIASSMSSAIERQRPGMVRPRHRDAGGDHVGVADGLDLLQAEALGERVEVAEQPIEQADDFGRRQLLREAA